MRCRDRREERAQLQRLRAALGLAAEGGGGTRSRPRGWRGRGSLAVGKQSLRFRPPQPRQHPKAAGWCGGGERGGNRAAAGGSSGRGWALSGTSGCCAPPEPVLARAVGCRRPPLRAACVPCAPSRSPPACVPAAKGRAAAPGSAAEAAPWAGVCLEGAATLGVGFGVGLQAELLGL